MPKNRVFAIVMLIVLVYMFCLQIQTTEAAIQHLQLANVFKPDFVGILNQPLQLVGITGPSFTMLQAEAVLVGWLIEIIYLAASLVYDVWFASIKHGNAKFANLFTGLVFGASVLNGITDYNYFTGDWYIKALVSLVLFFVSFYFGHGMNFIGGQSHRA